MDLDKHPLKLVAITRAQILSILPWKDTVNEPFQTNCNLNKKLSKKYPFSSLKSLNFAVDLTRYFFFNLFQDLQNLLIMQKNTETISV
jgi:hypothetical protein